MRGTLEREKPMAGEQVASTEIIGEQTRAGESTLIWNAQSVKIRYKSLYHRRHRLTYNVALVHIVQTAPRHNCYVSDTNI